MLTIRPFEPGEDLAPLAAFDTSFVTDRTYRVQRTAFSFALEEEPVNPPFRKTYIFDDLGAELKDLDQLLVAELGSELVGYTGVKYESWNRRMVVWHLYVASQHRKKGIGRGLIEGAVAYARKTEARCLWLETQNTNYPAVRFYLRAGFRLCGLDESLYDPRGPGRGEVGLFFARDL
ncbi:MAG: GNAT family N-acetyltransferase [Candidatus Latescibacteria bacterium]|nr:GNAT family N-acetyltransferase [Candidatus Latescibacterota bacterium]